MFKGCYTALVTPMKKNLEVDYDGLHQLIDYQVECGVEGILVMGTTGESATLNWEEHETVIERGHEYINDMVTTIAGTGSNSTDESLKGTDFVFSIGVRSVLLVDPYYNGPSSLEIRKEYVEPLAEKFPEIQFIPYVIPGRTGTQLLPQDLAILHENLSNVNAVKEATGDLKNMELTRKLCGEDFDILSGDDDKTFEMMTSPQIKANGVISVISNVVPKGVSDMVRALNRGSTEVATELAKGLDPFFKIVTVRTTEDTPYGSRLVKARNPVPCKTLLNLLGMPSGPCRRPLGKMTKEGLETVLKYARKVYETNPELLEPIEDFFDVDMSKRLYEERYWSKLHYV